MKILITGGCGFVGSNLAIYFKNNRIGTQINSLDNLSRKGSLLNLARLKKNKIKNFKVDIANSKLIRKLPKYDLIIDCCAEAAVEASKKEIDKVFYTNLVGPFNILKKCTKDKSNIIFLSSSRVYSIQKLLKLLVPLVGFLIGIFIILASRQETFYMLAVYFGKNAQSHLNQTILARAIHSWLLLYRHR